MKNSNLHKTLLVIIVGFLWLSLIFKSPTLSYIAIGIGTLSIISPKAGKLIESIWFRIALILGWINTRILLGIVFFLFLYPISLLFKLKLKNALFIKKTNKDSIYVTRNYRYKKKDLENTW